jgi:hypothetical protein
MQYWWRFQNGGNQWSAWSSYLSFFRHVAKLPLDYSKWEHYEAAATLAGPRFMHQRFWIVSDRPECVHRDAQNRPHRTDGPFCRWRDGWELHYVHGVRVSPRVTRRQYVAADIDRESNAEVRRVMVDLYGAPRYLQESGAKLLHEDTFGGQPRRLWRKDVDGDEPIVMAEVVNGTHDGLWSGGTQCAPCKGSGCARCEHAGVVGRVFVAELDDTGKPVKKTYWLRVHPELRPLMADGSLGNPQPITVHNAVASTFGMRGDEYRPEMES